MIDSSLGDVPTRHELEAALRVSQLVKDGILEQKRVRAGYTQLATDGIYGYDDFRRGEQILIRAGLLQEESGRLIGDSRFYTIRALGDEAIEVILGLCLENIRPSWIAAAVSSDEIREEYIPPRIRRRFSRIFRDTRRRDAFLASVKHSQESNSTEIGQIGEREVVRACRQQRREAGCPKLARSVRQVSQVSDHFGYDVSAPCPDHRTFHLEVKTTAHSSGAIQFHLSRNQYSVGVHDPDWRLVVCRKEGEEISVVGWTEASLIRDLAPVEQGGDSRCIVQWGDLQIRLRSELLKPGLPPVT